MWYVIKLNYKTKGSKLMYQMCCQNIKWALTVTWNFCYIRIWWIRESLGCWNKSFVWKGSWSWGWCNSCRHQSCRTIKKKKQVWNYFSTLVGYIMWYNLLVYMDRQHNAFALTYFKKNKILNFIIYYSWCWCI